MKSQDIENQFNIRSSDVKNAVDGVIKFATENPRLQNILFNEEFPIFLQINCFKIPKTRGPVKQVFRVPLKNSPLPSDPDVCLIAPDVKGIPNKEHERHLEHYETLLRSKDVSGIKKIMTFHEFRTEYDTFELKNRLVDLYDMFLVDGRISGKVAHKCGKIFYKKRKLPLAVRLHLPKLKSHIEESLKKAFIQISLQSDSYCVQIGYSSMKPKYLRQNVYSVLEFIDKQFPGGMDNIRSLNVYAHRGSSIPIYVSLKNPNDIKVPLLSSKKPKAYKSFTGELTTLYNTEVTVRPSGDVVKRKIGRLSNKHGDDNITSDEIIRENNRVDKIEEQNIGNRSKRSRKRKQSQFGGNEDTEASDFQNILTGKKKKKDIGDETLQTKVQKSSSKTKREQIMRRKSIDGHNEKQENNSIKDDEGGNKNFDKKATDNKDKKFKKDKRTKHSKWRGTKHNITENKTVKNVTSRVKENMQVTGKKH